MKFISDPPISVKISKMKQRVRWHEPPLIQGGIDQTRMTIEDGASDNPEFSFLVIGDSGSGRHRSYNPQRQVAEQMLTQRNDCRFVVHTGDVVYLVGASDYYWDNFIFPYREFLVGGEQPERIAYDRMVFNLPFLTVPGNHDYYDLPVAFGAIAFLTLPLRRLLRSKLDLDIGWRGSSQGQAYAQAFLDYLLAFNNPAELKRHLDTHYTAATNTGRCLRYQPGRFTRLPNRYYTFRYSGIDFFALDSNTFNAPLPLPATKEGKAAFEYLQKRQQALEQQKQQFLQNAMDLMGNEPDASDEFDDVRVKLEQIEESLLDIEKQLAADDSNGADKEQLDWLKQRLIESWNTEEVRGRVLFFHHPPYVTEATKWFQAQTLTVRRHLRWVLDEVAKEVGSPSQERPLVDLVLNGHAHCMEYLRTGDTGHGDSYINWIISGGSGYSLRRQRNEGFDLMETVEDGDGVSERKVAESLLFIGRTGQGSQKRRPYSFVQIDVKEGRPPKFIIRPFIAERFQKEWNYSQMKPFAI